MLTVGNDVAEVERRLSQGRLECPVCGGRLAGWGHARVRAIRLAGRTGWRVRPRRAACSACGTTHVLLPAGMLARRADSADVIGAALAGAAAGLGHRRPGYWSRRGCRAPAPPPGRPLTGRGDRSRRTGRPGRRARVPPPAPR